MYSLKCEIRGNYDVEVVREAASMVYRRIKADSSLRKRVPGFVGFDVLEVGEERVTVVAYASDCGVFSSSKAMGDFAFVVGYGLKMKEAEAVSYDASDYAEEEAFEDKETLMLQETDSDMREVKAGEERRMACYMFDVYYRVAFSQPMCREMMARCQEIEEDMLGKKYCEQLKVGAFEAREDVGYVRLTVRAADAKDAAEAAYERDSLLAFALNCHLQNKVDDLVVASASLLEEEGLLPSSLFSLLPPNAPLVLPPYSLPCGICQEKDCASFGVHLLYRDYGRADWRECLLMAFGPPAFYSPRAEDAMATREKRTKGQTVKAALKEAAKDVFKTPKRKRDHRRRYRRDKGASLLGLVGCVAYLGVLGVAAGVAWLKEKAEERKDG